MRIFSYILAMLVLVLNLVPCADAHDQSESIATFCTGQDRSHKSTGADACTPFCHCSCCAASTTVKASGILKTPFNSFKDADLHYLEGSPSIVSHSIWQPPKIG